MGTTYELQVRSKCKQAEVSLNDCHYVFFGRDHEKHLSEPTEVDTRGVNMDQPGAFQYKPQSMAYPNIWVLKNPHLRFKPGDKVKFKFTPGIQQDPVSYGPAQHWDKMFAVMPFDNDPPMYNSSTGAVKCEDMQGTPYACIGECKAWDMGCQSAFQTDCRCDVPIGEES